VVRAIGAALGQAAASAMQEYNAELITGLMQTEVTPAL
jgi:hypothetical protein